MNDNDETNLTELRLSKELGRSGGGSGCPWIDPQAGDLLGYTCLIDRG